MIWNKFTKKITLAAIAIIFIAVPDISYADLSVGTALAGPGAIALDMMGFDAMAGSAKFIGNFLMSISAFFLYLSGSLMDAVIKYTIVDMSKYVGNQEGLGAAISNAWRTLRDIANMTFIFVLLFVAFKAMFDLDFGGVGKSVRNIIIVALLINFSLFFSKVVIDASNIVSIGFYNAIVTSNSTQSAPTGEASPNTNTTDQTISTGYMRLLGLNSWYGAKVLEFPRGTSSDRILLVGIMSAIFMLITAIVLLISAIMFITRFIILIFLMILSPIAFIAYVLPGQGKYLSMWWDSLRNQSFCAPIFFALTWVSFQVATATKGAQSTVLAGQNNAGFIDFAQKENPAHIAIVLNYVLVIGLAIAALVVAKRMASSVPGFKEISGMIGGTAASGVAFAGRQTIGRASRAFSQSSWLRNKAAGTGAGALAARAGLWTADKGAKGSFDARAIETAKKIPGLGKELDMLGKAGGKGGIVKSIDDYAKKKADYAKRVYGPTSADKVSDDKTKEALSEGIKLDKSKEDIEIRSKRKTTLDEARKDHKTKNDTLNNYERTKLKDNFDNLEQLKKDRKEKEKELQNARKSGADKDVIEKLSKESESLSKSIELENANINEARKDMEENDNEYIFRKDQVEEARQEMNEAKKNLKSKIKESEYSEDIQKKIKEHKEFVSSGNRRQQEYAKKVGSGIFGWTQGNQAAKKKIEDQAKEKSNKDKLSEAAKALAKEDEEAEKKAEEPKEEKKESGGGEEKKT